MCWKNGNLDLQAVYKEPKWRILNKEFGSTYLCNRLSHRQLEGGKAAMGGCVGVVV